MQDPTPPAKAAGMKTSAKWLFTAISAALAVAGTLAIVTEVHTSSSRYHGVVTVFGDDAVWAGQTALLLAVLPLLVWLPPRWVGWAGAFWWLVLMAWIFGSLYVR
jgi:hypothetical protein